MNKVSYSRHVNFKSVFNFRDMGGYRTRDGHQIAWRKLFRSGYLHHMTENDISELKREIRLVSVIDLRKGKALGQQHEISLLQHVGIKYFNVPFISYTKEELQQNFSNMGEVYLFRIGHAEYVKRIIEAMNIMTESANYPLVFHCGAGKDRTGLLAAFVLGVLGVSDDDIMKDYALSAPYMKTLITNMINEPGTSEDIKKLPAYTWEATSESMSSFLASLKREFGSAKGYLEMGGAEKSLFSRLEKALLI